MGEEPVVGSLITVPSAERSYKTLVVDPPWRYFRYSTPLVWCKRPIGSFLGGAFTPSAEFVLFARRGRLPHCARAPKQWFIWPRQGQGNHSRKPDAFLDLVELVSPGPYLELFARRNRLGWDTWGNEALEHVEMGS